MAPTESLRSATTGPTVWRGYAASSPAVEAYHSWRGSLGIARPASAGPRDHATGALRSADVSGGFQGSQPELAPACVVIFPVFPPNRHWIPCFSLPLRTRRRLCSAAFLVVDPGLLHHCLSGSRSSHSSFAPVACRNSRCRPPAFEAGQRGIR